MLAKKYRLPSSFFKKSEKERVRPLKTSSETLFSIKIFSSPHAYARFAAVASNARFKKANIRNKARRRVYEAIREANLYKIKKVDCVIYLKTEILEADKKIIQAKLKNILE
jgi:ribonuclease P protein component